MTSEKETLLEGELQKELIILEGRKRVVHESPEQIKSVDLLRHKT